MLIKFSVSNYRSIGDEQILSLVPAPKQRDFPDNIFTCGSYEVLNAIGLYGANASGKSNLLRAMSLLDQMLTISARNASTAALPYDPFLLREDWEGRPTKFEITFLVDENVKYRYGFTYNHKEILTEWLFRKVTGREVMLFQRETDTIEASAGFAPKQQKLVDAAIEATRANALFLSFCDTFNIAEARTIFKWFNQFYMIDGLNTAEHGWSTAAMAGENAKQGALIKKLLSRIQNLGIADFEVVRKEFEGPSLAGNIANEPQTAMMSAERNYSAYTSHPVYTALGTPSGRQISWKMEDRESAGTNKMFHVLGPIVKTLAQGGVLIIDEIEARMHALLTLDIINFFLTPETNPFHAQLIFATHDTNLLNYAHLRRDQIYFAEKNRWEATEIFSLSDFVYLGDSKTTQSAKERPDTDKEKRYLEGRYGAVPVFNQKLEKLSLQHG